jgi:hypothetical protein
VSRWVGWLSAGALLIAAPACASDPRTGPSRAAPVQSVGPEPYGVPDATSLRQSGPLRLTEDGAVIERLDVRGNVVVDADDVTVRASRITTGATHAVRLMPGRTGLVLQDVEIAGEPGCEVGVVFEHYTAERVDVHGCADGMRAGTSTRISGSRIRGLRQQPDSHNDGIQVAGGTGVVIEGNVITNDAGQTACVFIKADAGPVRGVIVRGNHLDGGSYALYVRAGGHGATEVVVEDNAFGERAVYGPVSSDVDVHWVGNAWERTGLPVPLG